MMRRFRFLVPDTDFRPIAFPPQGPYWCTGYTNHTDKECCVLVAYAPSQEVLTNASHWPDAVEIEDLGEEEIKFSGRFPKPVWWEEP